MKYKKILIVYKKPLLEIYKKKSKELEKLIVEEVLDIRDLKAELREHKITKKIVENTLKKDKNIKVDWAYRANLSKELVNKYDLKMPFGGDGTLMETSHYIYDDKPVFGINSDYRPDSPDSSEGFLLSANKHNFPEKYKLLQDGKLKEYKFNRLQAELNGKKLEELIINDIVVSHKGGFGDTARIVLKDKKIKEFQKIDGLIIATPLSNWAIRHGGEILPITSDKISYVNVGLFIGMLNKDPKLEKGVTDYLEVYSKTREGILKLDGKHITYPFGLGAKLKIYPANKPLTVIGFEEEKRKYYAIKPTK